MARKVVLLGLTLTSGDALRIASQSIVTYEGATYFAYDGAILSARIYHEAQSVYWNTESVKTITLEIDNADGRYDGLLEHRSIGSAVVRILEDGAAYNSDAIPLSGSVEIEVNGDDTITLVMYDMLSGMSDQFNSEEYSGEDNDDINGTPKAFIIGTPKGVLMPLLSGTSLTYHAGEPMIGSSLNAVSAVYTNADALTVTTDYTVNLTTGVVTLLDAADAVVVTADIEGEHTGSNVYDTIIEIVDEIVDPLFLEVLLPELNTEEIETLSNRLGYTFDWADRTPTSVPEFMARMADSWGGFFMDTVRMEGSATRQITAGRWETPHTRSVTDFTEGDILSPVTRELDMAPGLAKFIGSVRNWHQHNETDIAGSVNLEDRYLYTEQWRVKSKITAVNLAQPYLSEVQKCVAPTMLSSGTDGDSEAAHRESLFDRTRYFYRFTASWSPYDVILTPGDVVKVEHPSWGLSYGTFARLVSYDADLLNETAEFTVWSEKGQYWPKRTVFDQNEHANLSTTVNGGSDTKSGTLWAYITVGQDAFDNTSAYVWNTGGSVSLGIGFSIQSSDRFELLARNSSSTNILVLRSDNTLSLQPGKSYAIHASWDLAAGRAEMYINGVDESDVVTATNDDIALSTSTRIAFGDVNTASNAVGANPFTGTLSHFGVIFGQEFRPSVDSERFFDSFNRPKRLDTTTWAELDGNQPNWFMPDGDPTNNLGSEDNTDSEATTNFATYQTTLYHNAPAMIGTDNANVFTGISNGDEGIFGIWIRLTDDGTQRRIFGDDRFYCEITSSDEFRIVGVSTLAVTILDIKTSALDRNVWYHIIAQWDLSAGIAEMYVNDAADITKTTVTAGTIHYASCTFVVGNSDESVRWSSIFFGDVQSAIDITVADDRRRFSDENLRPVYLGKEGRLAMRDDGLLYYCYDGQNNVGTQFATDLSDTFAFDSPGDYEAIP